jgi:hypothetical protein
MLSRFVIDRTRTGRPSVGVRASEEAEAMIDVNDWRVYLTDGNTCSFRLVVK